METTKIIKCNCKHEFQDKQYGQNMRVHNRGLVKGTNDHPYADFTCTVCSNKIRIEDK